MLDLKLVREQPDLVRAGALKKRLPDRAAAVDRALQLDAELRAMTPKLDGLRSEQKQARELEVAPGDDGEQDPREDEKSFEHINSDQANDAAAGRVLVRCPRP